MRFFFFKCTPKPVGQHISDFLFRYKNITSNQLLYVLRVYIDHIFSFHRNGIVSLWLTWECLNWLCWNEEGTLEKGKKTGIRLTASMVSCSLNIQLPINLHLLSTTKQLNHVIASILCCSTLIQFSLRCAHTENREGEREKKNEQIHWI